MNRLPIAICLLLLGHDVAAQVGNPDRDRLLIVPGSPQAYWSAAALSGTAPDGPRFLLEFIRAVEAMETNDPARLRAVQAYLAGQRGTDGPGSLSFAVPLPLRASVWSRLALQQNASAPHLFAAVIQDRRARRLLYGAAALDPETRAYFEDRAPLVERIYRDHADTFAAFGRSLRIRGGQIAVPGGSEAVSLWERVAGSSIADTDRFVERVLEVDGGQLAAFYDTLAHLDVPRQRFALGMWRQNQNRRRTRFVALYEIAREVNRRAPARPLFGRSGFDLFTMLSQVYALEDGRPAPPATLTFWPGALAMSAKADDTGARASAEDAMFDAAWLAETVLLAEAAAPRDHLTAILFGQRLFSRTGGSSPQAVFAARTFPRVPALGLALERAGVNDAAVYALAFERAVGLGSVGEMYWRRQLLTQYQGALAIVEQLRMANRLSIPAAEALLITLARLKPNQDRWYAGGVARWIADQLLPALGIPNEPAPTGEDAETRLLAALLGAPEDEASLPALTWEHWDYRVDSSIAPLAHLKKVRAIQAGNSLDVVLRLWRAASLLHPPTANEASLQGADRLRLAKRSADAIRLLQDTIREPQLPVDGTRGDAPDVKRSLREIVADLDRITEPRHLSRVSDIEQQLAIVVDVLTGDVLASLVYATVIRDPDSPLLLQGDVASRHDFGLLNREGLDPALLAWSLPAEQLGSAWHVRGSLLGLDLGLARLRLPQVATGAPPAPPVMAVDDRRVFIESVALFNPGTAADAAMHAIATATRAGRARVAAASRDSSALDQLAIAARIGEWRRYSVLPWLATEHPDDVLGLFSLIELYRIGASGAATVPGADAWGAPAFSLGGCLCLRMPPPMAWEDMSGRIGMVPALTPTALLRIAELMSDLKLPAILARHALPVLMRDFIERVPMVYSDDWTAVERYWMALSRDRIEDVVSQLTVDGPLIAGEAPQQR